MTQMSFFKRETKTVKGNVEVEKAVAIPPSGEKNV